MLFVPSYRWEIEAQGVWTPGLVLCEGAYDSVDVWKLRKSSVCKLTWGEGYPVLRMESNSLSLAAWVLTLSQICSLLFKVLPTKGLTPATHTRKSTPPQCSRACSEEETWREGKFLLQWGTIPVALGIHLDPVLERTNLKQGWRITGSLFSGLFTELLDKAGVSALIAFYVVPPQVPRAAISSTHLSSTSFLKYTVSSPLSRTL